MALKTTMIENTYHGWDSLWSLPELLNDFNVQKILLISDPFLQKTGIIERLKDALINYEIIVFDDINEEPKLELAEKLVSFAKDIKCELVIGIGGGSVLDLAKLVAVLVTHDGKVEDYLNLTGSKKLNNRGIPKVIIPTTSGTGSEVTNISVLALENTKDVIAHDYLLADLVILDPALTVTVPSKVTAATGIDALTHAIESYLSINANYITKGLALYAITLITRSLRNAVQDGSDKVARTDLSYGSFLAGLSFFNAGVAGVHALAYPLGGQYHISHGESNALLLPHVLSYIRQSCPALLKDIYNAMGFDTVNLDIDDASQLCINEISQLVSDVGIPATLQAYQISEDNLFELTLDAIKQTRLLSRSPMTLLENDILKIYRSAWLGVN